MHAIIVTAVTNAPLGVDPVITREYYQRGAPDPVLETELVLRLVRRHAPDAREMTRVDESGGEARTYYVDEGLVLKVQRPPQLRSWTSLEKEVRFLRQIAQDDPTLPVPRVLGYGREGSVEYTCMTRLPGDAAIRTPIPDVARRDTLKALGRVIRRVHTVQQAPLRESGLFPEEYTPEDLRISVAEDILDFAQRIEEKGKAWPISVTAEELSQKVVARVPSEALPVALHTNPGPTHTFVDRSTGHFTGLIDFGDAYIGHPVFDLWQWGDPADREAVLAGYLESGPMDERFWTMWDVAQVISDLRAIVRDRPFQARCAEDLAELVARW